MQKDKLKAITDLLPIEQSEKDFILSFDLPDDKSEYLKNCSNIFDNQEFELSSEENTTFNYVENGIKDAGTEYWLLQNGFSQHNFDTGISSNKVYDVFEALANSSKNFNWVGNFDSESNKKVELFNFIFGVHPQKTTLLTNKFSITVAERQEATIEVQSACINDKPVCQIAVTNILGKSGAKLVLNFSNTIIDNCSLVNRINVTIEDNCDVKISNCNFSGKLVQTILNVNIIGEGSTLQAPGISMPSGNQVFDYLSFINHRVGNCTSTQKIRTIASDNGYSNFYGLIKVAKDAQKTETDQINNNILLSETARIESKPQLEIYADDVKCSHGSTTGMLDSEAIFYMRSRGISEKAAQKLLIQAFTDEIVDEIAEGRFATCLKNEIDKKLS